MQKLVKKVSITVKQAVPAENMQEKYRQLADVDRRIRATQDQKAGEVSRFNADLKELRAEQKALLDATETGEEEVEVECYERVNDQLGQVETIRCDNGDILPEFTRALTADERQLSIEDLDPNATSKKRGAGRSKKNQESAEASA